MVKKKTPVEPIEIPSPPTAPETIIPDDPETIIPDENPDIIPEEDPFENPPDEMPEPGG